MEKILGKFSGKLYGLLRIVAGFMFMQHGAQKILGLLGAEHPVQLFSKMGLAGAIELIGGLLIMSGIFTSWAAFLASGLMAVGYFTVHAPDSFWTVINRGELAVLYCFVFLYLASRGNGELSLGKLLGKG